MVDPQTSASKFGHDVPRLGTGVRSQRQNIAARIVGIDSVRRAKHRSRGWAQHSNRELPSGNWNFEKPMCPFYPKSRPTGTNRSGSSTPLRQGMTQLIGYREGLTDRGIRRELK